MTLLASGLVSFRTSINCIVNYMLVNCDTIYTGLSPMFFHKTVEIMFCTTCRDASYTTQPLELLNDLGFENHKNHSLLRIDEGSVDDTKIVNSNSDSSGYIASPRGSPNAGVNSSPTFNDSQLAGSDGKL